LKNISNTNIKKYFFLENAIVDGGLRKKGIVKTSDNKNPLVSIVTIVKNGQQFLEQTIQSVIHQTYDNLEFIIVDGGSNDSTLDIINKYNHAIDYWSSAPDDGISDAFNKGVSLSSGQYINFQGADDYLYNNSVISMMMQGINPKQDMLICGRIQRVEKSGSKIQWITPSVFNKYSLLFRMSLPHQALFTNQTFFYQYGLFDKHIKLSMDYELLLRAYKTFPKVVMKDLIVSCWREGGIGTNRTLEIFDEYNLIKHKNKVAPSFLLFMIHHYILLKYNIKSMLYKKNN